MARFHTCLRCKSANIQDPKQVICDRCKAEMAKEIRFD